MTSWVSTSKEGKPEERWVVHLRPKQDSIKKVRAKIKALTTRSHVLLAEVDRLSSLSSLVRGWCEYYKHTSLVSDLESVSRYNWHRYHGWLLKKFKGSRKVQLIKEKIKHIHNRTRWTASLKEGGKTLFVHQWLPSPVELKRSKYLQKGRNGFAHPYLMPNVNEDFPQGYKDVDPNVYKVSLANGNRTGMMPIDMQERKTRVKIWDGFKCVKCGDRHRLTVHHRKGLKSHRIKNLEVLCLKCHQLQHGINRRE